MRPVRSEGVPALQEGEEAQARAAGEGGGSQVTRELASGATDGSSCYGWLG